MADAHTRRLLGNRAVSAFLGSYWHKKALLVPSAMPEFRSIVTRKALFALAARDEVQSRLVRRVGGRYMLDNGPFRIAELTRMPPRNWTLLVQGVNLHDDSADALLRRFAFIPYARLDDVMVSYAVPGGGVGPHVDSYDVFLLQGMGKRRWRYGRQRDLALRDDVPLRILRRFSPRHDAVLAPGDMLYLPPNCAHDGVAIDECMTYSIGFRAPRYQELAEAFVDHLRDSIDLPGRYADPDRRASRAAGRIDAALQHRVVRVLAKIRWEDSDVERFLGRFLTEPKADVVFGPGPRYSREAFRRAIARSGLRLDRRTQLLYDEARCYVNGDDVPLPATGRAVVQRLADRRKLSGEECIELPPEVVDLFHDWHRHGFLANED